MMAISDPRKQTDSRLKRWPARQGTADQFFVGVRGVDVGGVDQYDATHCCDADREPITAPRRLVLYLNRVSWAHSSFAVRSGLHLV